MVHQRPKSDSSRRSPGRTAYRRAPGHNEPIDVNQASGELLGRFSDALSLLAVAHGSLSAKEFSGTGDEEVAIRHALAALKGIYSELDRASISIAH